MASNALSTGDPHSGVGVARVVSFVDEPEDFATFPLLGPL
jgi:hypothetical protein